MFFLKSPPRKWSKKAGVLHFCLVRNTPPPGGQVCQGRQVGGRAGWRVGWSAGWLVWLAGKRSEFGWLAGWLVWLAGWLKVKEFGFDWRTAPWQSRSKVLSAFPSMTVRQGHLSRKVLTLSPELPDRLIYGTGTTPPRGGRYIYIYMCIQRPSEGCDNYRGTTPPRRGAMYIRLSEESDNYRVRYI